MRCQSCTNLSVERYEFRGQLGAIGIWQDNYNSFNLGSKSFPTTGILAIYAVRAIPMELVLNPFRKMLGYPHNICVTISPMSIYSWHMCSVYMCVNRQVGQRKMLGTFLSPLPQHSLRQNVLCTLVYTWKSLEWGKGWEK